MLNGYKTYASAAGLALLAILQAVISDPSVTTWLDSGKTILIAAAIAALRSALSSSPLAKFLTDLPEWLKLLNLAQQNDPSPVPPAPSVPGLTPGESLAPGSSLQVFAAPAGDPLLSPPAPPAVVRAPSPPNPPAFTDYVSPIIPPSVMLLALLIPAALDAAPPRAVINGPTTGVPGELLTLDASQSEGDGLKYLWRVQPDVTGRKVIDVCNKDGSRARIASLPGKWTYILVVSNAEGADLLSWTVDIPGSPVPQPQPVPPNPNPLPQPIPPTPGPTPVPVPGPSPAPGPPTPAPLSRFATDVTGWVSLVTSPTRVADAGKLAAAADAVSAQIAAGTARDAKAILAAMLAANNAAGVDIAAWKPFATKLQAYMTAEYLAGRLSTSDQFVALLHDLAAGLRAVK